MIIDSFKNLSFYENMVKNLSESIKTLKTFEEFKVGKYEYDWGHFMVQEGTTIGIEEGKFEAHDKYIDVQILLEGTEVLIWAERTKFLEAEPYNVIKDAQYYKKGSIGNQIKITPGMFYICFPHDGHKAIRHIDFSTRYKKL